VSSTAIRKVVVTWGSWRDRILDRARLEGLADTEVVVCDTSDETLAHLPDADAAFLGEWTAEMLAVAGGLKWVHALGGGVTGYLFPEMVASPLPFTCGKTCFAIPGAEFGLGAMFMFSRRSHLRVESPLNPLWQTAQDDDLMPQDISGKTVGIIGLGGMGSALAMRANALGMRVVGTRRSVKTIPQGVERLFPQDRVGDMLGISDYVVVAVPQTSYTDGMVGETVLRSMKDTAFLIDVSGRASIFDIPALVRAIEERWISGVCLQPSGHHPDMGMPPLESTFWKRPNVVVTPCRGTSVEQSELCLGLFFENLRRFEAGQPLEGLVDKEAGY
jgi:phosphoglycerate dehydrogenase-like enzyme